MTKIANATIAILSTHGFEKSELFEPKRQMEEAGATVHVIAPEAGAITSWDDKNWGEEMSVDKTLADAKVEDYDALILPGGQINPDILRANADAVAFIRDFHDTGRTLAAICHAPWLLIEAGAAKGRDMTSYASIKTDLINAGANWQDSAVVCDKAIVTSRSPEDLDAFCAKIIEEVREGAHQRNKAA